MEEKTTYSDATEAIEVADAADIAPQKKGRKVTHRVFNIVITVLATAAFVFFAVFASALIESYFDMKDFDGEGINGGAIGYAFALVFMIVTTVAVVPLSIAGIVISATSVKFRRGADRVIGIITLVLNSLYLVADAVLMVVAVLIGNAS